MTNIDLRILKVIIEVHKTRSVSRAADNLDMSQSAVSMNLARMRKHFHDPLFIRTTDGMEPTLQMIDLIELLEEAEDLLETALAHRVSFDPATSDRTFRLGTTDIIRATLLPELMRRLYARGHAVRVYVENISEEAPHLLSAGRLDLALGSLPSTPSGICKEIILTDRLVCAVRAKHPRVRNVVTLDQFAQEAHVVLAAPGIGNEELDKTLEDHGIRRKVRLRLPGCFGISNFIAANDYLAVVPERLGRLVARCGRINLLPLPLSSPPLYTVQHWHERYTHDPAAKWLRGIIADLFQHRNRYETGPRKRKGASATAQQ